MAEKKQIKTALVSVFHKDGLDELLKKQNSGSRKWKQTTSLGRANLLRNR